MFRSARSALVIGVLVTSHWFLDLVVHRPDLLDRSAPRGGGRLSLRPNSRERE
jgi:hypothetical protein